MGFFGYYPILGGLRTREYLEYFFIYALPKSNPAAPWAQIKWKFIGDRTLLKTMPQRESIFETLKKYKDSSNHFVSFTNVEKIGVNPNNAFSTPIGVYAYSLKDLWKDWTAGDDFFGKDRMYVNLLEINTTKVLNINTYQLREEDFKKLKKLYLGKDPFENLIPKIQADQLSLYHTQNEGDLLWKLVEEVARQKISRTNGKFENSKSFTIAWNKILRDLGYEAVIDKQSTIHLLQSSQALFLVPKSYKLLGRFLNKTRGKEISSSHLSPKKLFWHPGPNPTVDMVVTHKNKVLLIKRGEKSNTEAGKWALPGGFIDTAAHKGEPWRAGRETPKKAAIRELTEETGLYIPNIPHLSRRLLSVGTFKGGGRDPRDSEMAWSESHAFTINLVDSDGIDTKTVAGRDDAVEAKWFSLNKLPTLAFDHQKIIQKALEKQRAWHSKSEEDKTQLPTL